MEIEHNKTIKTSLNTIVRSKQKKVENYSPWRVIIGYIEGHLGLLQKQLYAEISKVLISCPFLGVRVQISLKMRKIWEKWSKLVKI